MDGDAAAARLRTRLEDPHVILAVQMSLWVLLGQFIDGLADIGDGVVWSDFVGERGLQIAEPFLF